tara:strand:+ start:631 stop:1074 length:444 start_codon:yes stop_codon:yes gene_type:complete
MAEQVSFYNNQVKNIKDEGTKIEQLRKLEDLALMYLNADPKSAKGMANVLENNAKKFGLDNLFTLPKPPKDDSVVGKFKELVTSKFDPKAVYKDADRFYEKALAQRRLLEDIEKAKEGEKVKAGFDEMLSQPERELPDEQDPSVTDN